MTDLPLFVLAGAVMIGVLVIVHEAGHYVVARLFKVGTPVFSIGMGPRIGGFHFWKTDFRISLLPIGGYVRMAGADAFGEEDADGSVDPDEDFMKKPVWQRLLVMLAGPAANLLLPFVLFTAVYMLGKPMENATIGQVTPGSIAEEVGLRAEDHVTAIDARPVRNWREVIQTLYDHRAAAITVVVTRESGREHTVTIPAGTVPSDIAGVSTALGLQHARQSSAVGVSDVLSPAWLAGIRPGDWIESVDGEEVVSFQELERALVPGERHLVTLQRRIQQGDVWSQQEVQLTLEPLAGWQPTATEALPDSWGLVPLEVFVGEVIEDSAAATAGVQDGDRLVAIDGTRIRAWDDVVGLVAATVKDVDLERAATQSGGCTLAEPVKVYGRALRLDVVRDGEPVELEFRPEVQRIVSGGEVSYRPIMGVRPFGYIQTAGGQEPARYSIVPAVRMAVQDGGAAIGGTLSVLGKLIQGELRPDEGLGGPIEIVRTAGYAAKAGVFTFVQWMGMISFSLGIINLLPVPVLDGGQILFYTIEGIRGRPLPLALRERVQMVGVLFLAGLMVMVIVNDIGRWMAG